MSGKIKEVINLSSYINSQSERVVKRMYALHIKLISLTHVAYLLSFYSCQVVAVTLITNETVKCYRKNWHKVS